MTLTPGKLRGLQTTSNQQNIFTILAIDHGASLAGTISPKHPETVAYDTMSEIKAELMHYLSVTSSAVLIDPVFGLAPAILSGNLASRTGLLLAVEDGDYASVEREARLFENWSVRQAKRVGANAIKCFFYYHPDDTAVAAHQEKFVKKLVSECKKYDLPLFAEPLSYNVTPDSRTAVVIETAKRISALGIDILKIEFPVDSNSQPDESIWQEACEELTAVCQTPWAILSAGVDFDTFARQVKVACQAGASGYLVGRAVWKEGVSLGKEERRDFWKSVTAPRLEELAAIATQYGKPWTAYYSLANTFPPIGWHQSAGRD